jgi:peptidoglycan/xylan/chitin deacetylase (PgdA/CDA1 family)
MRAVSIIFHGIGTPGRVLEPGEAPYWISVEKFERVLDRITALPVPSDLHITFDDGNLSDHDVAFPRLRDRGLAADIFVLTGRIGAAGSLGRDHIQRMQNAGFGIGSHGIAHQNWARLGGDDLAEELVTSYAVLQEICAAPPCGAAIPFGSYDSRVINALRQAGYVCAWSSDRGTYDRGSFLRARTSIRADTTDADLTDILAGHLSPAAWARRAIGMARKRLLSG